MKITNTNPELWKCPRCGQGPRDCRCGTSFTAFELAAAALLLAILLLWPSPVAAQCDPSCRDVPEPPITSTTSTTLYLPAMALNWHAWFDEDELNDAMRRSGYDPITAGMHNNCLLDVTAVPPYLMRYTSCNQYYVRGVATEGTDHYIWYVRLGDNVVHGLEVGS